MRRWPIRLLDLPGASHSERAAWFAASIPLLGGVGAVLAGMSTRDGNVVAVGFGALAVAYAVMCTVALRLQRRVSTRRLAELAAHNAATFERHEFDRAELDALRREVREYRELHGNGDDAL